MYRKSVFLFLLLGSWLRISAQTAFHVLPLGVKGGLDESNLSAYLVSSMGSSNFICLDAGTVYSGLSVARKKGSIQKTEQAFLKENIKGYFISHGHLDHVAGLILNSPEDSKKLIYALPEVLDVFKSNYFTRNAWANFGSEGEAPILNKYRYVPLIPETEIAAEGTGLKVQAFELSHVKPFKSTAFLVSNAAGSLLYLGDTGADSIEKSTDLKNLWQEIASLISSKKLKAILIEVSFPNSQTDDQLFGHLNPRLFEQEMKVLSSFTGVEALKGLPVVITHRKPSGSNEVQIKQEFIAANTYGLKLIFPQQGKMISF
ncbi:MAG: 3',5'-cyclic-nucleotide phosphodiesterase [Sphingobacteriaceae bacterium]|nr:3',5'-cyclic-nucleotide phosphodiesterase [Sphingobacteriaceae bacterium]